MSKSRRAFDSWLEQPSVGATGVLRSTLATRFYSGLAEKLSKHASLLIIATVSLISLLPLPNKISLDYRGILAVLGLYLLYIFVLEVASRKLQAASDRVFLRVVRIAANTITVSSLLWFSSGGRSYFWVLYLLPIFQAIIYFSLPIISCTVGVVLMLYSAVAWTAAVRFGQPLDATLLLINSLELLFSAFVFYVLFGSAREDNRLKYEEMEALRRTALDLTGELQLEQLLQKIIKRATTLLQASGGGIYRYDRAKEELTVVADFGSASSIVGYRLGVGEGLAGRVVKARKTYIVRDYSKWAGRARGLDPSLFRAVIGAPLGPPDDILGVLYITHSEGDKYFTPRDAQLLSLLASQAAIALVNAEAFEKSQRTLSQLELLNKINSQLSNALNLDEILQITLQEALKAVRAREGSAMMVSQKTGELEIKAWVIRGQRADPKSHKKFAPKEGIAGHVAATGQPFNCHDTSADKRFVRSFTGRKIGALLSVPIILNERVFCVINADSEKPNYFTDTDTELLSALALHVATAIESQRLRDVGISLSTLTLEEMYPEIVETACVLTGSQVSTIFLVEESSRAVKRAALYPPGLKVVDDEIRDEGGLSHEILATGKPITICDAQNDPRVKQSIKDRGVRSLMGAPLIVRVENTGESTVNTIGVLYVSTTQTRMFGKRDEEVLQSLANQAAVIIEKSRNVENLKASVQFKESLLASAFDAIVAIDENQKVVVCNPAAEKILGLESRDVIGTGVGNYFVRPEEAEEVARRLETQGRVVNHYTRVNGRGGEQIPIRLSATRLEKGSVGFFRDQREIESAQRNIKQLKSLFEASQAITQLATAEAVLETTVEKTIETLGADVVSLYPYDQEQDKISLRPVRRGTVSAQQIKDTETILSRFIKEVDIHFADDAQQDEVLGGEFVRAEGVHSAVGCTLKGGKVVGVIFCSFRRPHHFTDEEKAMMRLYFSLVTTAIENARLYGELERRAELIQGLYKAGLAGLPPEQHLKNLIEQARKLTGAGYAALEIKGSEWKPNPVFLVAGVDQALMHHIGNIPEGKGILGLMQTSGQVVNIPNVGRHPSFVGFPAHHPPMNTFLGTPITLGQRVVGNFYVANKSKALAFDKEDENYLRMLAGQAAMVIEGAKAQEELKVVQPISVGFLLLSLRVREVRKKKDVSAVAAQGVCELDLLPAAGDLNAQVDLNESFNFGQLLRSVALKPEFLHRLQTAAIAAGVTSSLLPNIKVESLCLVKGSSKLLEAALEILIENAVEAIETGKGPPVSLDILCQVEGGQIQVNISDSGPGIPPDVQKILFSPLGSTRRGFGYGSATAAMVFKLHGGNVRIVRSGADGTEIALRLPTP